MAKIGKICKEFMIKELTNKLKNSSTIFVTDCTGLGVVDLWKLRTGLKASNSSYVVIKNSLGKLALKNIKYDDLAALLDGTIGLVLSGADPIKTSKTLATFQKDSGKLKVRGGMLDGKMIGEKEVKALSLLPTREVLLAKAFGGMKAPINGLVNSLQGVVRKFVYAVDAIKKKKEGGSN